MWNKHYIKYNIKKPSKPQDAPAKAIPIQYGAKVQKTQTDTTPKLSAEGIKAIQEIVGMFNWYSRAADPTMTRTLSSIAARQTKATTKVREEVKQFLDYCASHPNATVRFLASDMILALHSDASYLSEPESKSRAAGHYYLANKDNDDLTVIQPNGKWKSKKRCKKGYKYFHGVVDLRQI